MIELLFKRIEQNFPLWYFCGESDNDIKNAGVLCSDCSIVDGRNQEEGS
jgi:hypothetical protein